MIGQRLVSQVFLVSSIVLFGQLCFGGISNWQAQQHGPLSYKERVACQKAIEEVYWRMAIWPTSNPQPKPSLETVMPISQIEAKTQEYISKSVALETLELQSITPEQIQTEMDRMAKQTAAPEVLTELWAALHNDPNLIAECIARPILVDRFYQDRHIEESGLNETQLMQFNAEVSRHHYRLPSINSKNNFDMNLAASAPIPTALHTAVWTGTSMIVWGGNTGITMFFPFLYGDYLKGGELNTGAIYFPATNSWKSISTRNAPKARNLHTAVWTGTEMIVWGGHLTDPIMGDIQFKTGGRYNPLTDSWRSTTSTGAPQARDTHTAIWTGTEMIIFGGLGGGFNLIILDTGGRYNPLKNSWIATPLGVPRWAHTAIWTGKEMILWGGRGRPGGVCCNEVNTGNRYNPATNSWKTVTTSGAPSARGGQTAIWTGTEMIVWGGGEVFDGISYNTGGRYAPSTNTWRAITKTNSPEPRLEHKAVWTGTEMIVWGGLSNSFELLKTGGRYNPSTNSWKETTLEKSLSAREFHSAVWTGKETIIWGGLRLSSGRFVSVNTGRRYNPLTNSWRAIAD